ncbi:hypothetical protein F511_36812 [Dorcoceras hygrometricum]|uniref:Uncharacterized protein n=1 Tax=Dorcoceras hygrometricum TaxID=472368 RepID=A0A2Z7DE76_9LAMI|nr:hypothetical protein F511_36812 [Dorcoceras hygrometricum]
MICVYDSLNYSVKLTALICFVDLSSFSLNALQQPLLTSELCEQRFDNTTNQFELRNTISTILVFKMLCSELAAAPPLLSSRRRRRLHAPPPPPVPRRKVVSGQLDEENPFVQNSSVLLVQAYEGVSALVVDRIGDIYRNLPRRADVIVTTVGARHKCQQVQLDEENPFVQNSSVLLVQAYEGVSALVVDRIGDIYRNLPRRADVIVTTVGARHKCQQDKLVVLLKEKISAGIDCGCKASF